MLCCMTLILTANPPHQQSSDSLCNIGKLATEIACMMSCACTGKTFNNQQLVQTDIWGRHVKTKEPLNQQVYLLSHPGPQGGCQRREVCLISWDG